MKLADLTFEDQVLHVSGDLDFSNVMALYTKSLPYIEKNINLVIDFAKLKSSNSAGIALLLEWRKLAKQYNKTIQFRNLPADWMSIAKTANIDCFISPNAPRSDD